MKKEDKEQLKEMLKTLFITGNTKTIIMWSLFIIGLILGGLIF